MENPPVSDKNTRVCSNHFLLVDFIGSVLEGFGPLKKPPPKRRKTSEARIPQVTHFGIIDELFSPAAGLSSQQDDAEPEPLTKDVSIQCS